MDIHRPKPFHGVREFLKEYGIIVLGVLTALGAEQAVENFHHRERVEIGEQALKDDFFNYIQYHAQLLAETPCRDARLTELRAIVDDGARLGVLGEVGPFSHPSVQPWEIASWETMVASQAAVYVPQEKVARYARIAHWAKDTHLAGQSEFDAWAILVGLSGPSRHFGDAEQASLRAAIERASYSARLMRIITQATEDEMVQSGLLTSAELDAARDKGVHRKYEETCKPIVYTPAAVKK